MEADVSPKQESLQKWVPGIGVMRGYKRSWLRFDLIAGVVLAAILVPQGMAYAELAGAPAGQRALHDDRVSSSGTRCSVPPGSWCWGPTRPWRR